MKLSLNSVIRCLSVLLLSIICAVFAIAGGVFLLSRTSGGVDQTDLKFLTRAFELAREGMDKGNYPMGAVVVVDGKEIGSGYNTSLQTQNHLHHAEVNAIFDALNKWGVRDFYSLNMKPVLYSTREPCPVCRSFIL